MERNLCLRLIFFLMYIRCVFSDSRCMDGMDSNLGYTTPHGDIYIRHGDPLNISCTVVEPLKPNQTLIMKRNDDVLGGEMYEQVDSRTIQLYLKTPPKVSNDMYYCFVRESLPNGRSKDSLVCFNTVAIGVAPQNITDFGCIGLNYDNLTCGFTMPENYVVTDYAMILTIGSNYSCKNCTRIEGRNRYECFFNLFTVPQYRSSHNKFDFTVKMNNTFGLNVNEFSIDTFKYVIPNPPENLTAESDTPHSIRLYWKIPVRMRSFPKNLTYRILYQCEHAENKNDWNLGALNTVEPRHGDVMYNLTGLKYAHTYCDIRVSLKSAIADDSLWSKNASVTKRTRSKIPSVPPQTNIGSFDITASDYLIYWKQISEQYWNGEDFSYHVVMEPNNSNPIEINKAFAKIKGLSPLKTYTFYVQSSNREGLSIGRSKVVIPKKEDRVVKPQNVVKIEHGGGFHQLSWQQPNDPYGRKITNYTVFWCKSLRDRPYQCSGYLNWTTVPENVQEFNQTLDESVYQYAVSANTYNSSSGMVWADCTIPISGIGTMRDVYSEVSDTWMVLHWSWDCRHKTEEEYVISYCPTNKTEKKCKEPIKSNLKNVTIKGPGTSGKIENLIPYTTYMINVYIKSKDGELRLQNDSPLFNTTNEGAPSVPTNVSIVNITNSSITVTWDKPVYTNGILKNYYLYIGDREISVTCDNKCHYIKQDLESYKNFTVSVKACTVACSEKSEEKLVTTKMGIPGGIVGHPVGTFQNSSHILINWESPIPPRGKNDYFELNIKEKRDEKGTNRKVSGGKQYYLTCSTVFDSFYVSVRAVNLINGTAVPGPWSPPYQSYCRVQTPYMLYFIIFICVLVICIFIYGLRRVYARCQLMRDVEVKLPPGLAPVVTDANLVPWTVNKHADDHDRSPSKSADEQVLLLKIKEGSHVGSADTSGCSSGHESVTSSLESQPISSTDSGTDQLTNDELKMNSLRQRYVPGKAPTSGYVLPPESSLWGSKPTAPSNYCKVGEPAPKKEDTSPYVTIDKAAETLKSPFLTNPPSLSTPLIPGDMVKIPNPSYVPYMSPEQSKTSKSGYVVAGFSPPTTKDLLGTELLSETMSIDEPAHYVKAADTMSGLKEFPWQQAPMETLPKTGYVSVGDAPPPIKTTVEHKGYVPHRSFESKTLKED